MIIEVFESANTEPFIAIKIENVDVSRVFPFRDHVGIQLKKEKLKAMLDEVCPYKGVNTDELEYYYAQQIPVWLDGNITHENAIPIDVPHHIGLRLVLESVLRKHDPSDLLQFLIG